jgi:hypothetical protein
MANPGVATRCHCATNEIEHLPWQPVFTFIWPPRPKPQLNQLYNSIEQFNVKVIELVVGIDNRQG